MAKKVAKKKTAAKKAAKPKPPPTRPAAKLAAPKAGKSTAKKATKAEAPAAAKGSPAGSKAPSGKPAAASPKASGSKGPAKPAPKKATEKTPTAKSTPKDAKPPASSDSKSSRKGITIVTPKPAKKPKAAPPRAAVPALTGSILGMGLGSGRPLIPSGPKAPPVAGAGGGLVDGAGRKPKSPFTKRQLDKYREVLIHKRRELLGDIDSMETEALKSQSGSLSHLPQHMAEQGSETYEQSLSLDLAAADRVLLREIDAALKRIADKVYGLCERTGKPISKERLAELPWARYSIEAAREIERRTS